MECTPAIRPNIDDDILRSWQEMLDLLAEIAQIPAALIMKMHADKIEVALASNSNGNPYRAGASEKLRGELYCETVIGTNKMLLVPNALEDPDWDHNPDIKLNMISYLGLPLTWPSGEVFGTICVLDSKENAYNVRIVSLIKKFQEVVNGHLNSVLQIEELSQTKKSLELLTNELELRVIHRTEKISKAAREAQLIHNVTKKANASNDVSETIQIALDEVCSFIGWPLAHAYLVSQERAGLLLPSGIWHMEDAKRFEAFKKVTERTTFESGSGLPGEVLETQKSAWMVDVSHDVNSPRAPIAIKLGIRAGMAFPIILDGEVLAVLEFFDENIAKPNESFQRIINEVAHQLVIVMKRQIAENKLRVSERHLSTANEDLSHALLEAETANKSKDQFLAVMSHELRTPLNAVIGYSEFMLTMSDERIDSPEPTKYLQSVLSSGKHLLNSINNILDLTSLKERGFHIKPTIIEVATIVTQSISYCDPLIEERKIVLESNMHDMKITCDGHLMKQVLVNILSNAIKFTDVSGKINLQCSTIENGIIITVIDNGIGMTEDEIAIALEPFKQVRGGLSRPQDGTGLGLPLVQRYLEVLGGELKITSNKGHGTAVSMIFHDLATHEQSDSATKHAFI